MRRRASGTPSSANLLLDTLSNALGGVIFIALLVVLLAYQTPVLESTGEAEKSGDAALKELTEELQHLPGKSALEQSLQAYTQAVDDYAKTGLTPTRPTASQDMLLAERARLKRLSTAPMRQKPSYAVPAIRKSRNFERAFVVVFKHGTVFSAPLTGKIIQQVDAGRSTRVDNLLYTIRGNTIQIASDGDQGQDVSSALNKLFAGIQSDASRNGITPDQTKLLLYVYPDSVDVFHVYRKQAMQAMPNVIWYGIPAGESPSVFMQTASSSGNEGLSF
jgi:hypothetical protein